MEDRIQRSGDVRTDKIDLLAERVEKVVKIEAYRFFKRGERETMTLYITMSKFGLSEGRV